MERVGVWVEVVFLTGRESSTDTELSGNETQPEWERAPVEGGLPIMPSEGVGTESLLTAEGEESLKVMIQEDTFTLGKAWESLTEGRMSGLWA